MFGLMVISKKIQSDIVMFKKKTKKFYTPGSQHIFYLVQTIMMLEFSHNYLLSIRCEHAIPFREFNAN